MNLKHKKVLAMFLVTIGLLTASAFGPTSFASAAAPIPAGCPGGPTLQAPNPTLADRTPAICDTIPVGCPGSTKQAPNPTLADRPGTNCPYEQTGNQATESECGNNALCARCSANDNSGCIDCSKVSCSDPATKCTVESCDIINNLVNPAIFLFSGLVGLVVALSIIIGAIQYSSSAGDPQKAAKGRDRIKNAIIALVAYIFLFAFLSFIIPGGLF